MKEKLIAIIEKYNHMTEKLTDPEIYNNQKKLTQLTKEHRSLTEIVSVGKKYIYILNQISDDKEILKSDEDDLKEIAQEEINELEEKQIKL